MRSYDSYQVESPVPQGSKDGVVRLSHGFLQLMAKSHRGRPHRQKELTNKDIGATLELETHVATNKQQPKKHGARTAKRFASIGDDEERK